MLLKYASAGTVLPSLTYSGLWPLPSRLKILAAFLLPSSYLELLQAGDLMPCNMMPTCEAGGALDSKCCWTLAAMSSGS
jgi:hypothetical protein